MAVLGGNMLAVITELDAGPSLTNLSTSFTLVRLLARVHTLVDCESGALDELFSAVGEIADVRPDAAVDAFYGPLVHTQRGYLAV